MDDGGDRSVRVLRSKRDASRYQILVTIADRQPAVSQQEIADEVGITPQAVSEYVQGLVDAGYVVSEGRGRYEVTKEGVDWLISRTEDLRGYTQFVTEEVIGQVEVETAVATGAIEASERVALSMDDGLLHAAPAAESSSTATAVATTDAEARTDVGVTDFEGLLDYDTGTVTVLVVPSVRAGGSRAVDEDELRALAGDHDLVAVAGVEAVVAARRATVEADLRFGTATAVQAAAVRGLSVLLVTTGRELSAHTDRLREHGVGYELLDRRER